MDYAKLAAKESIEKVTTALTGRGYEVTLVKSGKDALEKIKNIVPQGASVMNGTSVTLEQIGYFDYLAKGKHGWVDLNAKIKAENNKDARRKLRRESALSDYYLGSVHGLAETGDFVVASNTGSQLPHVVFTSSNLIFIVSTKKIVPDLGAALKRVEEYVLPLEAKHVKELWNINTGLNKIVIFKGEAETSTRKVNFILVEEDLGF